MRAQEAVFAKGDFCVEYAEGARIVYTRADETESLTVIVNASDEPFEYASKGKDILTGNTYCGKVEPMSAVVLK